MNSRSIYFKMSYLKLDSEKIENWPFICVTRHCARGGHGLLKVLLRLVMPDPSMPCGRAATHP
jgi:hypothetical protein